jgi:U3 small nucleolar RNA-associated protein 18
MSPAHVKNATKSSTRSKNESRKIAQAIEETGSGDESDDMMEKDEDEEELDRLVLGDDAGFTSQLGQDMDLDMDSGGGDEGDRDEEENEDIGLEGVDDADVGSTALFVELN